MNISDQWISIVLNGVMYILAEILYYVNNVWSVEYAVQERDSCEVICASTQPCDFVLYRLQ